MIPASIALSGEYSKTWPDTQSIKPNSSEDVEDLFGHQIVRILEFQSQNNDDLTPTQNKRFVCFDVTKPIDPKSVTVGNFGLPGIIDLPSAKILPDGESFNTTTARNALAFRYVISNFAAFRPPSGIQGMALAEMKQMAESTMIVALTHI